MRQKIKADGIKLHLGAFDCSLEGWLNTDITPHIWISRMPFASAILYKIGLLPEQRYLQHKAGVFSRLKYMDLTKPLPLPDESCVAVFSSHVLEHLFVAEVKQLLAEIRRVLKYGGVCRIVVPDLERIMALYDKIDPEPFLEGIFEAGKRSNVKNSHHSGFTAAYLRKILLEAGFGDVTVLSYHLGKCPDLVRLDNRPEESLFVEAVK